MLQQGADKIEPLEPAQIKQLRLQSLRTLLTGARASPAESARTRRLTYRPAARPRRNCAQCSPAKLYHTPPALAYDSK